MSDQGFPNVRVRLRLSRRQAGVPDREDEVEIWMKGSRFHVRDVWARGYDQIVGDATESRGLGQPARTMEEMMDAQTQARERKAGPPAQPTELFGDLATNEGWVYPSGEPRWKVPAAKIAPVASQILDTGGRRDAGLASHGDVTRLGRPAIEYRGTIPVEEDGKHYQNEVTRVLSGPFVLLDDAHDASAPMLAYRREVIALDEGVVTDADVTPP